MDFREFLNESVYSKTEIEKARKLGRDAFKKGLKASPAKDKKLMSMFKKGVPMGSSMPLMKAWGDGWTEENLK